MDQPQAVSRPRSRLIAALPPVVAVCLIVFGAVLSSTTWEVTSFGEFDYASLSSSVYFGPPPMVVFGMVDVLLGLLILAFWSGFMTGRRKKSLPRA